MPPLPPPVLLERAEDRARRGRRREARELLRELAARPGEALDGEGWLRAGRLAGRLEALSAALACLRKAVARAPHHAPAWATLGGALALAGEAGEAEAAFEEALRRDPALPEALRGLARLREGRAGPAAAAALWERLAADSPRDLEARLGAARCLEALGEGERARRHLEEAVRHHPRHWQARRALAHRLLHDMEPEAALVQLEEAAARAPAGEEVRAALAADRVLALERAARVEEACRELEAALGRFPGACCAGLAVAWERVAQHTGGDEAALAYGEALLRRCELPPPARELLHFALGRLLDRLGRPAAAFRHFAAGNTLQPRRFDPQAHRRLLERVLALFGAGDLARAPRAPGRPGEGLVLVVGMPRSGTSLVERILAAHPAVRAGGERQALGRLGAELLQALPLGAGLAEALDEARCAALAARYWEGLERPGAAGRVTDKMPSNFWWLGLAGLILPGARVVHCRRHPLDTCLSCFMQDFRGGPPFTQRLEDLAEAYRGYRRLMAHWERVQPVPMLELDYEALVERPQEQVRRLLDFLELPWDGRCLRFHEQGAGGRTATASYAQVRRPLYREAVGRWRRYAAELEPLRRELADYLDEAAPYGYR